MTSDFYNAFVRHDKDADILWQHQRWANSDHHYGLAAECALKALLLKQGIKTQEGDPSPEYKKHINQLWDKYISYMQTRNSYLISETNPFDDWNISQRYENENNISMSVTSKHRSAVESSRKIVKKAEKDGVL